MASQGPNSPGTVVDDATVGTVAWTNPSNAGASDNVYAVMSTFGEGGTSHYLKATNFGFSIPGGATINGILVEIETKISTDGSSQWSNVRAVKGGSISTTANSSSVGSITTTDSYSQIGGATSLLGETWTADDINSSTFGIVASINTVTKDIYIDHIRITVYYTEAAGSTTGKSSQLLRMRIR